jgi:copper chaperone CopZ
MAGSGVKLFVSGEVAYASEINTYLMDQVISVFDSGTARDNAFGDGIPTSAGGNGRPLLSEGKFCYLKNDNVVQYWSGSAWIDSSQFVVGDGTITTVKIADNSITSAKIAAGTVIAADIADNTITEAKLTTSVAGSGLSGGNGTALAVNVDSSTIEVNADTLRVKDAGIVEAKLDSGSVTAAKIGAGAVTSAKLDTNIAVAGTFAVTGNVSASANVAVTGNSTVAGNSTVTGTSTFSEVLETVQSLGQATGALNINMLDGAIHFYPTSTSASCSLDFRGNASTTLNATMADNQSITAVVLINSGSTTARPTAVSIDGVVQTVKWFGGLSFPNGSGSNAIDAYTFVMIKTATSTYTVFASQSKFA